MKVSEAEHSYNPLQMDKWNLEIEVCCMSEEDLTRLDLTVEILELLSIHMASRMPPPRSLPTVFGHSWTSIDAWFIQHLYPGKLEMDSERLVFL